MHLYMCIAFISNISNSCLRLIHTHTRILLITLEISAIHSHQQ